MRKDTFRAVLEARHGLNLAEELVTMYKKEVKLYKKSMKALTKLILELPDSKLKEKDGKLTITVKELSDNQREYFKRTFDLLQLMMKYSHPQVKAVEVKTDETGKIAFNINIPDVVEVKKKPPVKKGGKKS